jgi:dihydroxyacetone kinase-like predicted kinase
MRCGVVAVAAGAGMRRLYEQLGAHVVEGGHTLNPSTFELLAGIHEVAADEVVVLPNSGNVILAAERAAELSEKDVVVIDSRWPQAGLAALVEHDHDAAAEANAARIGAALARTSVGAVAPAARDDKQGRFAAGEAVGFVGEEIVAWGDPADTLAKVFARLGEGGEIVTWFGGEGAPLDAAQVDRLAPDGVEVEGHDGGQPHYWWLIAAE